MAFNPFDLTGKVALITGGNSGIGLGMAEGLAAAGASVVIWGGNEERLAAAKAQLEPHGVPLLVEKVDVGDEAAVGAAIKSAIATFGRLDFVAANAGVGGRGAAFSETTTEDWRAVTRVNLDACSGPFAMPAPT